MEHSRKPYQTEITNEVVREYSRQQLEKQKSALQKGADMDDVCTRVVDIEGSVAHLEDKIGESHKRMEEMLRALLNLHGVGPSRGLGFMNHMMHGSEQNDPAENIPVRMRIPLAPQSPILRASLSDAVAHTTEQPYDDGGVGRQEVGVVDV